MNWKVKSNKKGWESDADVALRRNYGSLREEDQETLQRCFLTEGGREA